MITSSGFFTGGEKNLMMDKRTATGDALTATADSVAEFCLPLVVKKCKLSIPCPYPF